MTRLLMVEDDLKMARLLKDYLTPLGYEVDLSHHGPEGLQKALSGNYDAIILDVMLPGMNGMDVLRELRRKSAVPVLMLTALGDEPDRIAGLEVGADDYVPKTFSTRELLARLRAVLRRSQIVKALSQESDGVILVGELEVEHRERTAKLAGELLTLTPIEFEMLLSLAKSAGRVKSREQLLLEVAERDFESFDRSIDVHISSLRKKLGDDAKSPKWIETVRGIGYRMKKPGVES